jgi:hypothetical protein
MRIGSIHGAVNHGGCSLDFLTARPHLRPLQLFEAAVPCIAAVIAHMLDADSTPAHITFYMPTTCTQCLCCSPLCMHADNDKPPHHQNLPSRQGDIQPSMQLRCKLHCAAKPVPLQLHQDSHC